MSSALGMGGAVWLLNSRLGPLAGFAIGVPAGALLFVALLRLTRALSLEDRDRLGGLVTSKSRSTIRELVRAQTAPGRSRDEAVNRRAGESRLYAEATRGDGERVWMQPVDTSDEAEIDAYLTRAARIDPDIWVVEIDDNEGRHFLTETVEKR